MDISQSIRYIGVNDHRLDLFEGQYPIPNGMAYNSYVILDEKIAVMDSVDADFGEEWMEKLKGTLRGRRPDYLIVQHMEPDHSTNMVRFVKEYPEARIVSSAKGVQMMKNYFGAEFTRNQMVVEDGDQLDLGEHTLIFFHAPMVHWPEVIMTYDTKEKILFSADAFGKFGALDVAEDWTDEARRYYIGIIAPYGAPVQAVLKRIRALEIQSICPLHGPVLTQPVSKYLELYHIWSSYIPEEEGVVIAHTSVYGNTRRAVELLAAGLREQGLTVVIYDLIRCDLSVAVADAFRYSGLILATTTYNGSVFPFMRTYIDHLKQRGFQNRKVAFVENGSWAPVAAKTMRKMLEPCKNLTFAECTVSIVSAMKEENLAQIRKLVQEWTRETKQEANDEKKRNQYTCTLCGWEYDEERGYPEGGIAPGTKWEDIPKEFKCPICKVGKDQFKKI